METMNKSFQDHAGKSSEYSPSLALREAMKLQEIEGNPLSSDQVEMFSMFERENWPHEKRIAYILERAKAEAAPAAE